MATKDDTSGGDEDLAILDELGEGTDVTEIAARLAGSHSSDPPTTDDQTEGAKEKKDGETTETVDDAAAAAAEKARLTSRQTRPTPQRVAIQTTQSRLRTNPSTAC